MAVIQTGLTTAGIRAEFQERLAATPKLYPDLTTKLTSDKASERYAWMGATPALREWGTGRKAQGMYSEAYDVTNRKYEATLEIDRDELSDAQHNGIRMRITDLAERAAQHPDSLLAALLINGASAGFSSYDGVSFFNAAHISGKSGSQSNLVTLDASDANAPTSAEFRAALGLAIARLLSLLDDQAEPANFSASGLVAIVPPSMLMAATEAVNSTILGSTTNTMQGIARVVAFSRLTTASVFYLAKVDTAVRPFIFQEREPLEFSALDRPDDSEVFLREKMLFGVRARYAMTYGLWQRCLKITYT